jgi:ribosomal protein S12 methylthiotransferase
MRGRNRSKPIDVLVEEARDLAERGVKELVVVAEDSTAYGLDMERRRMLHELLEQLSMVDGIEWIRLMYAYPHTVQPELTTVMRDADKVVPYLDIPIQHISTPMLRAMKRGVSSSQVRDILGRLREEVPGIAVRTTLIVGFPGETEADFDELRGFVEEYRFERLGVFTYSAEDGTPAFDLDGAVAPEVAEQRRAAIMELQRDICAAHNTALVGQTVAVLVDGRHPDPEAAEDRAIVGRTVRDAPEVDCAVHLPDTGLHSGDLVLARIVDVDDYDLLARVTSSEAR